MKALENGFLILECVTPEFVERFWEYVRENGYVHKNKSTGETQFYRFKDPENEGFVAMIELFSRKPDEVFLIGEPVLAPIPMDEEISSLSAILLSEEYYDFLRNGRVMVSGIPVLDVKHLIPFKAKAFLDNDSRKKAGEKVDSRDIKKHKNDVFRLLLMLTENEKPIELPEAISEDMTAFIEVMAEENVDVKALGAGRIGKDILLERLGKIYGSN